MSVRLLLLLSLCVGTVSSAQSLNSGAQLSQGANPGEWNLTWDREAPRTYFIQWSDDLIHWHYFPDLDFGPAGFAGFGFTSSDSRFFVRLKHTDAPHGGDAYAADFDGDRVSNFDELNNQTDPFTWIDADSDSIPDDWEFHFGIAANASTDSDGDSLLDVDEFARGTDPTEDDSDGDGMPDGWEHAHSLNPLDPSDSDYDADGDSSPALVEYFIDSDPTVFDAQPFADQELPLLLIPDADPPPTSVQSLKSAVPARASDLQLRVATRQLWNLFEGSQYSVWTTWGLYLPNGIPSSIRCNSLFTFLSQRAPFPSMPPVGAQPPWTLSHYFQYWFTPDGVGPWMIANESRFWAIPTQAKPFTRFVPVVITRKHQMLTWV